MNYCMVQYTFPLKFLQLPKHFIGCRMYQLLAGNIFQVLASWMHTEAGVSSMYVQSRLIEVGNSLE